MRLALADNGLKDTAKGFSELVVKVVLGIDGDRVLKDEDRVLGFLVIFGLVRAFDNDIGDSVTEGGRGTGITFAHAFGELDVRLFSGIVGFREGFGDDELAHVDTVLEEIRNQIADVTVGISWEFKV